MTFCIICLVILFVLVILFGTLYIRIRIQSDILAGLVLEVTQRDSVCDELPVSACTRLPSYCTFKNNTCVPK